MTLLFMDGFDHYDTSYLTKKGLYSITEGTPTIDISNGRRGGGCLSCDYAEELRYNIGDPGGIVYTMGVAVYFVNMPTSLRPLIRVQVDTAGSYIDIHADSSGYIRVWSSPIPGAIYQSAAGFFTTGTWYYLEMQFAISPTIGTVKLHWDDVELLNWSGDNHFTGSQTCEWLEFKGAAGGVTRFDDFYLLDDNGSKNNTFLGPCRVDTIRPDGAGNYAQMTPVNQIDNYECVNEAQLDEGDFVYGENDGEKDSYTFPNLASEIKGNIPGIQVNFSGERTTPDTIQAKDLIRKSSTDYLGSVKDLDEGVTKIKSTIHETDPSDSSDWNKSKIDACEFGANIII